MEKERQLFPTLLDSASTEQFLLSLGLTAGLQQRWGKVH